MSKFKVGDIVLYKEFGEHLILQIISVDYQKDGDEDYVGPLYKTRVVLSHDPMSIYHKNGFVSFWLEPAKHYNGMTTEKIYNFNDELEEIING